MDLHRAGIAGRMFNFIQNFLKPRSFKVKMNKISCGKKVQTEGIPTFVILNIYKIVAKMPNDNRFQISLYMDVLHDSRTFRRRTFRRRTFRRRIFRRRTFRRRIFRR